MPLRVGRGARPSTLPARSVQEAPAVRRRGLQRGGHGLLWCTLTRRICCWWDWPTVTLKERLREASINTDNRAGVVYGVVEPRRRQAALARFRRLARSHAACEDPKPCLPTPTATTSLLKTQATMASPMGSH